MMKNIIYILLLPCLFTSNARGQFKNIILGTHNSNSATSARPGVAVNLKDKNNIICVAAPGDIYVTNDGGENWTTRHLSSSFAHPMVISDRRGDFYFFYKTEASHTDPKEGSPGRLVYQRSNDEGESWSGEIALSETSSYQGKQWAVADPNSGSIYATWTEITERLEDGKCYSNILFSENNGGKRWSDPVPIDEFAGNCGETVDLKASMPAIGPDGHLYVVWPAKNRIFMDRSLNDGKNWLRSNFDVRDIKASLNVAGIKNSRSTPILICDNSESYYRGMLYLSWTDQRNGKDDTDIWFIKSANFGDTWTSPVKVNDDTSGKHQFLSSMTMDNSSGVIYVAYYDRRNYEDLRTDVYLAYSNDGGSSFNNKKISEKPFIPDERFESHISIAAHDGRIVPVWTRIDDGKQSIVTAVIEAEELINTGEKDEKKSAKK